MSQPGLSSWLLPFFHSSMSFACLVGSNKQQTTNTHTHLHTHTNTHRGSFFDLFLHLFPPSPPPFHKMDSSKSAKKYLKAFSKKGKPKQADKQQQEQHSQFKDRHESLLDGEPSDAPKDVCSFSLGARALRHHPSAIFIPHAISTPSVATNARETNSLTWSRAQSRTMRAPRRSCLSGEVIGHVCGCVGCVGVCMMCVCVWVCVMCVCVGVLGVSNNLSHPPR